MRSWLRIILVAVAFLAAAACDQLRPRYSGVNFTGASWGKELRLPDSEGRERTLTEFRGKTVMVFFGFVHCPVVCPAALALATQARNALGPDRERVQVIFITLDPERDTPDIVRQYATAFDPSFIALRGDLERTREVAKEFRVYFEKVPAGDSYTIDHTALTYVFDDQGRLRLGMSHQHTLEQYVADLRTLMKPEG
jgi:protein SCO1/2